MRDWVVFVVIDPIGVQVCFECLKILKLIGVRDPKSIQSVSLRKYFVNAHHIHLVAFGARIEILFFVRGNCDRLIDWGRGVLLENRVPMPVGSHCVSVSPGRPKRRLRLHILGFNMRRRQLFPLRFRRSLLYFE